MSKIEQKTMIEKVMVGFPSQIALLTELVATVDKLERHICVLKQINQAQGLDMTSQTLVQTIKFPEDW